MRVLRHKKEEMLIDDNSCMRFTVRENETGQDGNMEVINIIFVIWIFCSKLNNALFFVKSYSLIWDIQNQEKWGWLGYVHQKRLKQRHLWKFPETAPSNCTAKPSQNKSHLWKPPETARAIALPRRVALLQKHLWVEHFDFCADIVNMLNMLQTHLWSEGFDFCVNTCAQTL